MPIDRGHVFVAGLISGLTQEAQNAFINAMGGKGNPAFNSIFNERTNSTAIVVLDRNAPHQGEFSFEDVETLVQQDLKEMDFAMVRQNGQWHRANHSAYPSAGYLWKINLSEQVP